MAQMICPQCGTQAKPVTYTPGSFIMELALWLCFLVPGIIYSLWRITSRKRNACPKCHTPMIPLDTPIGKELQARYTQQTSTP